MRWLLSGLDCHRRRHWPRASEQRVCQQVVCVCVVCVCDTTGKGWSVIHWPTYNNVWPLQPTAFQSASDPGFTSRRTKHLHRHLQVFTSCFLGLKTKLQLRTYTHTCTTCRFTHSLCQVQRVEIQTPRAAICTDNLQPTCWHFPLRGVHCRTKKNVLKTRTRPVLMRSYVSTAADAAQPCAYMHMLKFSGDTGLVFHTVAGEASMEVWRITQSWYVLLL